VNLHRLVRQLRPQRPRPDIERVTFEANGAIHLTAYMWMPVYATDPRGNYIRDENRELVVSEYRRAGYASSFNSPARRTHPWACSAGVTHTRYWTWGTRGGRHASRWCEHTDMPNPRTGSYDN